MNYRLLNPVYLMLAVWSLVLTLAALSHFSASQYEIVRMFLRLNNIGVILTDKSLAWSIACLAVFTAGALCVRFLPGSEGAARRSGSSVIVGPSVARLELMVRGMFLMFCVVAGLTLLWAAMSIVGLGGLGGLQASLEESRSATRGYWEENKLFMGMRLIYSTMIGLGIFAMACRAFCVRHAVPLSRSGRRLLLVTLLGVGALLFVLPLVLSQRLLFGFFLIGTFAAYLLVSRRSLNIVYGAIGVGIAFSLWIFVESIGFQRIIETAGVSRITFAIQKFLFYFGNNIGNLTAAVEYADGHHTFGFLTFRAFFSFLTLDAGVFRQLVEGSLAYLNGFKGGGNFTVFGITYIDFGAFGLLKMFILGMVAFRLYQYSLSSLLGAQIYALTVAVIIFSFHTEYYAHPNLWINIAVLVALNKWTNFVRFKSSSMMLSATTRQAGVRSL